MPRVATALLEARLGQRDDVHVALDDQGVAALADRRPRLEQAVELAALDEHRRLGRVQVLRLAAVEHPAAEADHRALHRADRKHDPVAEAVVALAGAGASSPSASASLAALGDDQAAFLEQRIVVAREDARQAAPAFGRVAEAEAGGDLAAQAAALQVGDGARRSP